MLYSDLTSFVLKFFLVLVVGLYLRLGKINMHKSQLQVAAQKSCFSLPSYTCVREGPDHAPRFKAIVNFNGETFESPNFFSTLRRAEHSAAEVALKALRSRWPSNSLAARMLDETGVYKNLLQEVSQRVGGSLPSYTTYRSGLGHLPVFTCTVELAGIIFTGEPAKNKKQAEKNAAMAAWTSLKSLALQSDIPTSEKVKNDEQEHITVARALQKYLFQVRMAKVPFPIKFPMQNPRPPSAQQSPAASSKILPFICPRPARSKPAVTAANSCSISSKVASQSRPIMATANETMIYSKTTQGQSTATVVNDTVLPPAENARVRPKFPAAGAAPYIPIRHFGPHHRIAPPVTMRNAIPVFSSPPLPPASQSRRVTRPPQLGMAPPTCIRQAMPVLAAPVQLEQLSLSDSTIQLEEPPYMKASLVKFDEPLGSKLPQAQMESPSAKAISGRVKKPPISKIPTLLIGGPPGSHDPPTSEVSPDQFDLPAPVVGIGPLVSSTAQ